MSPQDEILILPPSGEPPPPKPTTLDLSKAEVLGRFGPFRDGLPPDWTAFQGSGHWETRDGCLYGNAPNGKAAILRWETEIEGNHAIRYRGAAIKHADETDQDVATNGNLNCIWDYTGTYTEDDDQTPYAMSLAGFGGWYSGMSGIELLDSVKGVSVRAVASQFLLVAGRTYDIVAGRVDDMKFVFADGRLVMAVQGIPPGKSLSRVAVSTWGRPGGSEVRIESVEVYRIPTPAIY